MSGAACCHPRLPPPESTRHSDEIDGTVDTPMSPNDALGDIHGNCIEIPCRTTQLILDSARMSDPRAKPTQTLVRLPPSRQG